MTPAARVEAAIQLLDLIIAAARDQGPAADTIIAGWLKARRYAGSQDRRAIRDLVYDAVRLCGERPASGRAAMLALAAVRPGLADLFDGSQHGPSPVAAGEAAAAPGLAPDWLTPLLAHVDIAALLARAPLDLRVNRLKTDRAAAMRALGAGEPTPFSSDGLRLDPPVAVEAQPAFRDGWIEVQDEGSQLIAALVDARPGMRVADLCAGAAGKTLAMAMAMQNKGKLLACDVSAPRLAGAAKRLARAGVDNAETHLLVPGDRWAKRRAGGFDRVLVDAPCTGTGTWRRNPDARTRTAETDLAELLMKQREILDTSAQLVRPGGRLIYATCSLLPEEDELQVEAFLERHPAFRPVPLERAWAEAGLPGAPPCPGPWMALSPAAHGTDGFFAAVLERGA